MDANNLSRRTFLELFGATTALGLAGCGTYTTDDSDDTSTSGDSDASTSEASLSDSFTIIGTQPNTLNMIQSASNLDSYCFYLTQTMLFRPYDGVWNPEAVDTMEVDDSGMVYTYHLKDGLCWSDGTAITAADFAYYLTALLDPANGAYMASNLISLYHFKNADKYNAGECGVEEVGIQATDDSTLVIELDQVVADFDGTFTCYPLSADFVAEQGEALGGTAENYMSSGPYTLDEWAFDSHLTYTKNDAFTLADGKFQVKTINWLQKNDDNSAVTMFEGGDADAILQVSNSSYSQLEQYITRYPGGDVKALELNFKGQGDEEKAALLSNQNFKLALTYALDRESIAASVNVLNTAIDRFLNDPIKGKTDDTLFVDDYPVEAPSLSGDADKAAEFLAAALDELGYASVADLPELTYLTFENDDYRNMAELVVDQWKQVLGIECVTIDLKPIADAIQSMMGGAYDIYYQSLSLSRTPAEFMGYWTTTGSVNDILGTGDGIWSNPEYDELIANAASETDREARMEMYAKAEQLLIDGGPLIPITTTDNATALREGVSGYMYNSFDQAVEVDELTVTAL